MSERPTPGFSGAEPSGNGNGPTTDSDTSLGTRRGLPASATWLRDSFAGSPWNAHPNYSGLAAFWQQVHRGLRMEGEELRTLLDDFRSQNRDPSTFERALSSRLQRYLGHLDFHHHIEDDAYFPRFRMLDDRLIAGFDLLEGDHQIIHQQLVTLDDSGKRLIGALRSQPIELQRSFDGFSDAAERLIGLLDRHLDDEEDLVIPVILKHGDDAVS